MSAEKAMEFMNKVAEDGALQAQIGETATGADAAALNAAIADVAGKNGYDCTADDVESVRVGLCQAISTDEDLADADLSDSDLEAVAGGNNQGPLQGGGFPVERGSLLFQGVKKRFLRANPSGRVGMRNEAPAPANAEIGGQLGGGDGWMGGWVNGG